MNTAHSFDIFCFSSNIKPQHILIPKRNEKDLADLPDSVKSEVKFTLCSKIEDVLINAFSTEEPRYVLCQIRHISQTQELRLVFETLHSLQSDFMLFSASPFSHLFVTLCNSTKKSKLGSKLSNAHNPATHSPHISAKPQPSTPIRSPNSLRCVLQQHPHDFSGPVLDCKL